jgi:flagellar basal body rod protein FlgG
VEPVQELVQLIELMRSHESGARVLKKMGRLNSELIQTTA